MYWRWKPLTPGSPPFGPFVNRNHFATWVVLALPLTVGYLAAHAGAHRSRTPPPLVPLRRRIVTFFDGRAMLLTAAICMMAVGLVATLSRSGLFGMAAAAAAAVVLRLRHDGAWRSPALWWIALAGAGAVVDSRRDAAARSSRLARTQVSAPIGDYPEDTGRSGPRLVDGNGRGCMKRALVFQRTSPGVRFNQPTTTTCSSRLRAGCCARRPGAGLFVVRGGRAWPPINRGCTGFARARCAGSPAPRRKASGRPGSSRPPTPRSRRSSVPS